MVLRTLKRSVIAAVLTSMALASYSLISGRSLGDAHAASTAPVPTAAPAPVVATPPMTDAVHRLLLLEAKVPAGQLYFDRFY